MNILSSGGVFSSKHVVNGPTLINGDITADGPLTILSNNVLRVDGSITAPEVTLSTLPNLGGQYVGTSRARELIVSASGSVMATDGPLTVLAHRQRIDGTLEAPAGKMTLIAADSATVNETTLEVMPASFQPQSAQVETRGTLKAPVIEIYSDGFITNSGRIETFGPSSAVFLDASGGIDHRNAPGSIIIASQLVPQAPQVILTGTTSDPNEGNNPGGQSTAVEFPDLANGSFQGKRKTILRPTQFSSSTVSQNRLPSVLKPEKKRSSNALATRGGPSKKKSKKRSFFGIVTKE